MREREFQRENERAATFRSALLHMFAATNFAELYSHFEEAVAENSGGTLIVPGTKVAATPGDTRTIEVPQGRYTLRSGEATAVESERLEVLTASFISAARSLIASA